MKSIHDLKSVDQYKEYLRTYFAAMAMQGLLSNSNYIEGLASHMRKGTMCVREAIDMADELLKQLEDGNNKS